MAPKVRWELMRTVFPRVDVAFVHIPKTGGTAIEMAAWRRLQLPWGIYYAGRWQFLLRSTCGVHNATCARCTDGVNGTCMDALAAEHGATTSCPTDNPFGPRPRGDEYYIRRHCCDWWHIPPPQLTHDPRPYYALAPHRFCVVRNPYERLLSTYMATWFPTVTPNKDMCSHRFLTRNITTRWTYSLNAWVALISRGYEFVDPHLWRHRPQVEWAPKNWSAKPLGCWVEPQSAYLAEHFSTVNDLPDLGVDARDRSSGCNIVLRYESLQADFTALMRWARLDVSLPKPRANHKRPGRANASCFAAHGARELLLPYTRGVVQQMYARDFEVLGYTP